MIDPPAEIRPPVAQSAGQPSVAGAPGASSAALEFALGAARLMRDSRVEDVVVIDLRGRSSLADFFVVGTGTSQRQMSAVLEHVARLARERGERPLNVSDSSSGTWLLADYVDVVVHLFDAEHRAYYDLDGLWGEAPRILVPD